MKYIFLKTTFFLFIFVFILNIITSKTQGTGADNYDVQGWVFVDQDNDGRFTFGIDTPLSDETVRWSREPKTTSGALNLTTNGSGFFFKGGVSENDPSRLTHRRFDPYPQQIITSGIRAKDGGDQNIADGTTVNIKGKDQVISVYFMVKTPPAPFSITSADCVGVNSIRVNWSKSEYVTPIGDDSNYYDVYRDGTKVTRIRDNSLSFTDATPGITPGITYNYYILAHNPYGENTSDFVTASTDACTTLSINDLKVQPVVFKPDAQFGVSGLQSTDTTKPPNVTGSDFYNPMIITLDANFATEYYVAFYNQNIGLLNTKSSFIADVQNRLRNKPRDGFLLSFRQSGTACPNPIPQPTAANPYAVCDGSFVYEAVTNKWISLAAYEPFGYNIGAAFPPTIPYYYYVRAIGTSAEWRVWMWSAFQTKPVYTGVLVRDASGTKIDHRADITPIQ